MVAYSATFGRVTSVSLTPVTETIVTVIPQKMLLDSKNSTTSQSETVYLEGAFDSVDNLYSKDIKKHLIVKDFSIPLHELTVSKNKGQV